MPADVFAPVSDADTEWLGELGDQFRYPSIELSFGQSLTHRLRRSYLVLLLFQLAAWIVRVTLFDPDRTWHASAGVPGFTGSLIMAIVVGYYVGLVVLTVCSVHGTTVREFEA